ncbi:hypothetical protein TR51_05175 [Kitasatospora griseola]|uniref:Lipoprotein n=1 Tax=Kitasatospora griseola TaxID=2064 RepID=A0A0D0NEX9_KITGR|nr:hypothetical protein [Kitasatospora griseola]KIQ66840.1 hypothetical protein TR51_05175 [Kitasatospora griseola]
MHGRSIASTVLGAALLASLCACGSASTAAAGAPATPGSSPSVDERLIPCPKRAWPQPIPARAIGNKAMFSVMSELDCFNVTKAVAPDGHDILDDDLSVSRDYIIVKITPDVGTMVGMDDEVVLTVDTHMPGASPQY